MEVGLKDCEKMGFEETELRLGLPGNINIINGSGRSTNVLGELVARKRGFSQTESHDQTLTCMDLNLNLISSIDQAETTWLDRNDYKMNNLANKETTIHLAGADPAKPPAKTQVVGWPPVRSFRKNMLTVQKNSTDVDRKSDEKTAVSGGAAFVKVSMDGAPYLRKVDLKMCKSYQDLSHALSNILFSSFSVGKFGSEGILKDLMNERKVMEVLKGCDYVPTYEDKDGDWMLVGDVPWEMFVETCKRLRIMKGKEAIGLAPRTMEKCKNRS